MKKLSDRCISKIDDLLENCELLRDVVRVEPNTSTDIEATHQNGKLIKEDSPGGFYVAFENNNDPFFNFFYPKLIQRTDKYQLPKLLGENHVYFVSADHLRFLNRNNKSPSKLFQEYNDLVILTRVNSDKRGNIRWLCACTCGNVRLVKSRDLTWVKSCKECVPENYEGMYRGSLYVLKRAKDKIAKDGTKVRMWQCECNCGKKVLRTSRHLKRGNCCCNECRGKTDRVKFRKVCGNIPFKYFNSLKMGARKRGFEFAIDITYLDDLFNLQNKKCAYSGEEIYFGYAKKDEQTASLDRINSSKGYVKDNLQWVHKRINKMKFDCSNEEFLVWIKKIFIFSEVAN